MSAELSLIDANVLVYSCFAESQHHVASRDLVSRGRDAGGSLCVVPQVLTEFYSIVTNPCRVTRARSADEAMRAIEEFLAMPGVSLLPIPDDATARLLALLHRCPVTGARVFDVQIVAVMLANGVKKIYTFNRSDFERFAEIQVLTP